MPETEVLDNQIAPQQERRRKLLPIWMKVFLWLFMAFGIFAPIGLILGLMNVDFNLALYGLETNKAISSTGLIVLVLFALKGLVSFSLWTEKDWAIKIAIVDAILGFIVCIVVMILPFVLGTNGSSFSFRFEFIILIPYLLKLNKIKYDWENRN